MAKKVSPKAKSGAPKRNFPESHFTASKYPATYRQREVNLIVQKVRSRQSLIVSSLGGGGKTHLMQFLVANRKFRQRCFPNDADDFAFFLFDCNAVVSNDLNGLCRLLISELGERADLDVGRYLRYQASEELLGALKQCLNALYQENLTLVFILDRFDKIFSSPEISQTLDKLRYLRDNFARQLVYLLGVRGIAPEIPRISSEFNDILAHPPCLYLPPLSQADAELSIALFEKEHSKTFDKLSREKLIGLSGGFPRLLRAACEAWDEAETVELADDEALAHQLLQHGRVREVCQEIWADVPVAEQKDLHHVARTGLPIRDRKGFLFQNGLVVKNNAGLRIFCPLFTVFLNENEIAEPDIDFELVPPNKAKIDEKLINSTLSAPEYKFLAVLIGKKGGVVTYQELRQELREFFDSKASRKTSFKRYLGKLASQVRKRIETMPGHEFIKNVHGVGYSLTVKHDRSSRRN